MTRQEHHDKAEELASTAARLLAAAQDTIDVTGTIDAYDDGARAVALAIREELLQEAATVTALAQVHATLAAGGAL
jgi:hypothetical protein